MNYPSRHSLLKRLWVNFLTVVLHLMSVHVGPITAMESFNEPSVYPVIAKESISEQSVCPTTLKETNTKFVALSVTTQRPTCEPIDDLLVFSAMDALSVSYVSVFPRSQSLPWSSGLSAPLRWSSALPWWLPAPVWWFSAPPWRSAVSLWWSSPPWWSSASSAQVWWSSALPWWSSAPVWWSSALLWWSSAPSALPWRSSVPPCWAHVPSAPPWWAPVPFAPPWRSLLCRPCPWPLASAQVSCSAVSASVPGHSTSTWTWPSVPPPVPPPLHHPPGLYRSVWKPLLGGGYVTNLVHALPFTRHQRSLAHHMDSCTALTVEHHLRLHFP